jgi:hypothetical protein
MIFNTNYILPGDDKNQIIGKVNYNFSQILSNAVGLPGEKGVTGPQGIKGQVGKDGSQGLTGTRGNIWIFQSNPPYTIPDTDLPLINYDVWINTSATGSTGGPNRIYYYDTSQTTTDPTLWSDSGSNLIVDTTFTLLQGVSGPGEVTTNSAIVVAPLGGTTAQNSTFVFTDRSPAAGNANPTYSKVLIESDASSTVSLPVFSLGKTFFIESNLPSFYWKTTSNDYGIKFSSSGELDVLSQATGSYGSTGGTSSVSGVGINFNSFTTLSVSGTGGISMSSSSLGIIGLNSNLGDSGFSLSSMSSGATASVSSSSDVLSIDGLLLDSQTGERTVLNYSGFYSGTSRNSLDLSMSGFPLVRVGNFNPSLMIGYTGSTGVSGGTGANICKSYQGISDSASSQGNFAGGTGNYIQITPSNDIILITPNPTGSISSNGRTNRIWLYLTGLGSYVDSSHISTIDLFMNSTVYSIGGISIQTNYSFYPLSNYLITDNGTGITGGCRHVRINFLGSSLPSSMDPSGNKYAYVESFVSGLNSSARLIYSYGASPSSSDVGTPDFGSFLTFG